MNRSFFLFVRSTRLLWFWKVVECRTDKLGAEFKFHYKDRHRSTRKITEFVPGKKVAWHVVDSHINFVKNQTEWNGTNIVFDIAKRDDKTELRFTHVGLAPGIQCYGDCSGAWGFYESLRGLITTGKGQPAQKEKGAGSAVSRCSRTRVINDEVWRRTYVPSMHRKHSNNGHRSRIHGRNPGGVHRQVQEIFQSENKGEIRWQQARRETRNTGKGTAR
jgi:hypothetical protein